MSGKKVYAFPAATRCKINIIVFNFNTWKRSEILQLHTHKRIAHTRCNSLAAALHVRG